MGIATLFLYASIIRSNTANWLGNNWLVLLKSTAIVSMIGLSDMTWRADQAGRTTRQPFVFYLLVCALYLVMTSASSWLLARRERRYSVGVRHAEL